MPVSLSKECNIASAGDFRKRDGYREFPARCLLLLFSCTHALKTSWGTHPQDRKLTGVVGMLVVRMSDNTIVVPYLKK